MPDPTPTTTVARRTPPRRKPVPELPVGLSGDAAEVVLGSPRTANVPLTELQISDFDSDPYTLEKRAAAVFAALPAVPSRLVAGFCFEAAEDNKKSPTLVFDSVPFPLPHVNDFEAPMPSWADA